MSENLKLPPEFDGSKINSSHCKHGHPWASSLDLPRFKKLGSRHCVMCARAARKACRSKRANELKKQRPKASAPQKFNRLVFNPAGKPDALVRLLTKVSLNNGCWEFSGALDPLGYGLFSVMGKNVLAHRASFWLHKKPIPEGMIVMHKCDNPSCVHPDHLHLGTYQENTNDMMVKGRQRFGGRTI